MIGYDTETNRPAGWPHRQRRMVFTVFFSTVLAIAAISSCRKAPSTSPSTGQQPSNAAQVEHESALQMDEPSCREFVQQFYDWYVSRAALHLKSRLAGPPSNDVLQFRPQVLSAELALALREDTEAQAKVKDDLVGLDFDPFLNSQDVILKFEVASVRVKDGRCNAVVNGIEGGKKQELVMPELTASGGTWVFVNFHYGKSEYSQDENLLSTLKQLSDERKKPGK
jgi:hypothetical protein